MYWITLNFHYLLINENRYCLQMAPVVRPVSLQIIATSSKCQRIRKYSSLYTVKYTPCLNFLNKSLG
jgi:hypothetical protein